jgi:hypothetical protein
MLWLALLACKPDVVDEVPLREAGVRAPLTATCDDLDTSHCLLPFPSSTFTRADPTTETGVRVALSNDAMPVEDSVEGMNQADGFSRLSGVAAAFNGKISADAVSWDPANSLSADSPLQVINAQPDHADYGQRVGYRAEVVDVSTVGNDRSLIIGRPVEVLAANTDYVVVLLEDVGGEVSRGTEVALGLVEPSADAEAALFAYHGPTRDLLAEAQVESSRVVRVWDFTTRSATDPTWRMHAMMDALDAEASTLAVAIDNVIPGTTDAMAAVVKGRLIDAPSFLTDDGLLATDDEGRPVITGTTDVVFRMSVPTGDSYKVALYGHGTGGDENDNSFDQDLAEHGIAKLNIRFDGWTGDDFVTTIGGFTSVLEGSERSTAGLMQALAGGTVLLTSLEGALGDALEAETGVRPDTTQVAWVGGSMGGTMGAVMVGAEERLTIGVLNVPGAGWTHMVPHSLIWQSGLHDILQSVYTDPMDLHLMWVVAQNNWDEVDGGVWADEALDVGGSFLLQESLGDPILPNLCTELLANALGAVQVEPVLEPIVGLTTTTDVVTDGASLTQFKVPDTGQYDVHGFAARDTLAADAAIEQINHFLETAWAGSPEMTLPAGCSDVTPDGSCDFSEMWDD